GDADTECIQHQQRNRQQELRNHIGRRERRRDDEDGEDRIAPETEHHLVVDHAELSEEEGEDRHLERERERQQQLRRESEIFTDADSRGDADARVLGQEEGIADSEDYGPAEIYAEHEKNRRKENERLGHPALGFVQPRRNELPDFVKDCRARDEQAGDQRDFDLGVEGLADSRAYQQYLAAGDFANRPGQHVEERIGDEIRDDESEADGGEGANTPGAKFLQSRDERHRG